MMVLRLLKLLLFFDADSTTEIATKIATAFSDLSG